MMTIRNFDETWTINTKLFAEEFGIKATKVNVLNIMNEIGFDECYCSEWAEIQ